MADFSYIFRRRGGSNDGQFTTPVANEYDEQLVAQGLPDYTEVTRLGRHRNCITGAVAPLVAIPTTVTALEIWNNIASDTDVIITDVFYFHLLGTAALHNPGLWAMVTTPKAVPTLTALTIFNQNGGAPETPTVGSKVVTGQGTTIVANGWRPIGNPTPVISTALPGEAASFEVAGRWVVPPGSSFCLQMTDALATASSMQLGASWVERPLTVL